MIKSNIGLVVCGGFAIILSVVMWSLGSKHGSNQASISTNKLLKSMNDTLVSWKDKEGKNNAKIASIQAERNELLDIIDKRDSVVRELLLNPKVKSVTKIKTETKFDTTIVADSATHSFDFDNGWIAADIKVQADTMNIKNLLVRNELIIDKEEIGNGVTIHVKQSNPYTKTAFLKDYTVQYPKQQKSHWFRNLVIGLGVGLVVGSLVH